jgi:hypothetical protein
MHGLSWALFLLPLGLQAQYTGGIGHGDGRALFASVPVSTNIFLGGNGHGDLAVVFQSTPVTPNISLGGIGHGDISALFQSAPISPNIALGGDGRGDVAVTFDGSKVLLALKAFLEGPYANSTGLMGDALRSSSLLPTGEPYTALGYTHVGGGGETTNASVFTTTGNNAIVDWVVVELRDPTTPATVLATRCGLLQRDGDIVGTDGISPLAITTSPRNYQIALRHRNHLGAMTLNSVNLTNLVTPLDLSSASTATFGTGARKSITGTFPAEVLWDGDVTFNGQIKYTGSGNDRDPILTTVGSTTSNNTVSLYSTRDVNLDGTVKYTGSGNDRDPILVNVGSTTPNNVRTQQLP